jgi:hypothetical protein
VTLGPAARDGEIEAFIVDRYLESLLERQPHDEAGIPADLRSTAARLVRSLPRYHPSFRFEEQLAARLQAAAEGRLGSVIAFPTDRGGPSTSPSRSLTVPAALPDDRAMHPVVIGGVLTSAALSLAGAAYVAWRRNRPPAHAMSRAVRAVARARVV